MAKPFDMEVFKAWLVDRGAIIAPPTNPYEVLRVETCNGVGVVYRNARGKETWPLVLVEARDDFANGRHPRLSPDRKARQRLSHLIEVIAARDGMECWFSGVPFADADDDRITVEHLLAVAHGGSNHLSNLVLATAEWNRTAGNLSIAEKVRLRDEARVSEAS